MESLCLIQTSFEPLFDLIFFDAQLLGDFTDRPAFVVQPLDRRGQLRIVDIFGHRNVPKRFWVSLETALRLHRDIGGQVVFDGSHRRVSVLSQVSSIHAQDNARAVEPNLGAAYHQTQLSEALGRCVFFEMVTSQDGRPALSSEGLDGVEERANDAAVIFIAIQERARRFNDEQFGAHLRHGIESRFKTPRPVENHQVLRAVVGIEQRPWCAPDPG